VKAAAVWRACPSQFLHSFGGWKRSLFGDMAVHGMEGVRFHTRLKTLTARWPGIRVSAEYVRCRRCRNAVSNCTSVRVTTQGGRRPRRREIKGLRDRGAIFETVRLDAGQRGSPWSLRVEIRIERPAGSPIDFVSPRPIKSASSGFAE
jgi:hypothetical protein